MDVVPEGKFSIGTRINITTFGTDIVPVVDDPNITITDASSTNKLISSYSIVRVMPLIETPDGVHGYPEGTLYGYGLTTNIETISDIKAGTYELNITANYGSKGYGTAKMTVTIPTSPTPPDIMI